MISIPRLQSKSIDQVFVNKFRKVVQVYNAIDQDVANKNWVVQVYKFHILALQ